MGELPGVKKGGCYRPLCTIRPTVGWVVSQDAGVGVD